MEIKLNNLIINNSKKWDYENGFYLTSKIDRMSKIISHYELFKLILSLEGSIIECGVYKGSSFVRLASFRGLLEKSSSRKIIGFDAFGNFPLQDNNDDNDFIKNFEMAGGPGLKINDLEAVLEYKSISNYELIKGDIINTIPKFINDNPEIKIAMLHIDVDVFEPTKVILNNFYSKVVKGGVIIFDNYNTALGETNAIDDFFFNKKVTFNKFNFSKTPTYYVKR